MLLSVTCYLLLVPRGRRARNRHPEALTGRSGRALAVHLSAAAPQQNNHAAAGCAPAKKLKSQPRMAVNGTRASRAYDAAMKHAEAEKAAEVMSTRRQAQEEVVGRRRVRLAEQPARVGRVEFLGEHVDPAVRHRAQQVR